MREKSFSAESGIIVDVVTQLINWIRDNLGLVFGWAGVWLVCLVLTVVAARYYLISIPPDYFAKPHRPLEAWRGSHPALRWTLLIAKNAIGGMFVTAGIVMLVTPGPGWIALLLGLYLVDAPGKRALEKRILKRPTILRIVNHMRAKARQPALEFSHPSTPGA